MRQIVKKAAFTLIEAIVVIAIVVILATFAAPALNSLVQARGITEAGFELAAILERARSEAVARQTYIWLGFEDLTDVGGRALRVGLIASADGSSSTNSANLSLLAKPWTLRQVAMTASPALETSSIVLGSFRPQKTLTFTPVGEVLFAASPGVTQGFATNIALTLRQTRGATPLDNNPLTVAIDGSTGSTTILR